MRGIAVAAQPEAAEAAILVLAAGGNAIDAAVACAPVQGVVDPQMAGIAGFGTMRVLMPAEGVIPRCVTGRLERAGYPVVRSPRGFAFGAPYALVRRGTGWQGGADPQRDGVALHA